ncbi:hypothetical protein WR25_22839 isoform A [Diploscapter pachys]|uniref:Ubiquitin-like domain-containing protein n=1 Tax=Diploscapter pachys TaxID=2018661 RepID=A0A2A2LH05_9BILA|nr:hypothetical protein WR25_22839 isoform A [Diploscapter pachys]
MRLIYTGANMVDTMVIKDVLAKRQVVDGPQIFHLVCPLPQSTLHQRRPVARSQPMYQSATQFYRTPAQTFTPQYSVGDAVINGSQATPQVPTQQYSDAYMEYARRWQMYQASMYGYTYGNPYMAAMYSQTHMQYPGVYSQVITNGTSPVAQPGTNQVYAAAYDNIGQNAPAVGGDAALPQNPAAPAIVNDEAVAPAGGRQMDALERFYRFFKLIIFAMVLFMYDISFERMALVFCLCLFLILIRNRRNAQRAREQAVEIERMAERIRERNERLDRIEREVNDEEMEELVNNNNHGEPVNQGNANEQNGAEADRDNATTPPPAAAVALEGQGVLGFAYSFITSFFLSLVPENAVPMDMN